MNFQARVAAPPQAEGTRPFETVSVIGLGYIGLPTAAVLAARGVNVVGVDINPEIVETVNRGEIHIVEPTLDQTVRSAVQSGCLRASASPSHADAYLIAVPTPITTDKKANTDYVMSAGDAIAPHLQQGDLVILESTSPVGTTERLVKRMAAVRPDLRFPERSSEGSKADVSVAYCPERVLPGKVVEELVSNDRAIGGLTKACTERAVELYRLFVHGELVATDVRSAELCKLAENAFRDVNIAYANELANVCDGFDMDVWEVIRLANRHPRVGILKPGPGVGGHCIAVDPWFIADAAPEDTPIIQAARGVNDGRPTRVVEKIKAAAEEVRQKTGKRPTIALMGLAFKPDIDDLRESPATEIAKAVADASLGSVIAVEPNINVIPEQLKSRKISLSTIGNAIETADVLCLLVPHSEFHIINSNSLKSAFVVDACGLMSTKSSHS